MKKLMIVAPKFRYYADVYQRIFKDSSQYELIQVDTEMQMSAMEYISISVRRNFLKKEPKNNSRNYQKKIIDQSEKVIAEYRKYRPDIVMVVKGEQVLPQHVHMMQKHSKTILLCSDTSLHFPNMMRTVSEYDCVVTYDADDAQRLAPFSKNPILVQYGNYDESKFYIKPDMQKDIDVSFVGVMYPYRMEILERLSRDFRELNMVFYGCYAGKGNPVKYLKWYANRKTSPFKNMEAGYETVNDMYNRSKIVLNILNEQSQNGWENRTAEILGSGAFALIRGNPAVEKELNGKAAAFYGYDDLADKIRYYLKHEEERQAIARNGHHKICAGHTYRHRVKEMLNLG